MSPPRIATPLAIVLLGISQLTACRAEKLTDDWSLTTVPSVATDQNANHYSWYRCYVKTPDNWAADSASVFTETISLAVEHLTDAHEVYVNGTKIGSAGMPPNYRSTREETNKYKIHKGLIEKNKYNVIALRIYSPTGPGGFKGRAPIIAGYFKECQLKGDWEFHLGDNPDWAINALSEKPTRALFDNFTEATSALRRPEKFIHGTKLPPAEALAAMQPANGLEIDQLFTEPLVAQPLCLRFDERGRLWISQYRQYPYPAGIKMVSRDKYYRAVYDKVPQAPPNHYHGADRITVHEDTNNDGTFDRHHTFADNLNIATSALPGRGGVWVLNPPYLLFYHDADNDCTPDADPVVHLEGFGLEDVHSVVNSLNWGPDGWLYGAQGSTVSSHITVKVDQQSDKAEPIYCEGAAIWRYHPETHQYEIYAEGGGNAFGTEFDSQGRLYSGHNGGDTRGFYYIQGGYYTKANEGKYGTHSNPYAFGMLSPLAATKAIQRFSHAFLKYEESSLPVHFHNKLFAVDPLHRNVVLSATRPTGSSFTTDDIGFAVESDDISFRPVAITTGPDGAVYIADFCEEFIAHGQNYQGQIDPTSGRVYRLHTKGKPVTTNINLSEKSTDQLVDLLSHDSRWYRQTALRLLADRQDTSINARLIKYIETETGQMALESLWALNLLDGFDSSIAQSTLSHTNPSVRRWTVRLLGEKQHLLTDQIQQQLSSLANNETDAEVRCQLAATAKRLPADICLSIVNQLLTHDQDADDPAIPLLLWWAIESTVDDPSVDILSLFTNPQAWERPLIKSGIAERLMRRYATSGTRTEMLAAATLFELAPDSASQQILLKGFELAFQGRSLTGIPPELATQLTRLGGGSLSLQIRQGDATAIEKAHLKLLDTNTNPTEKIELVTVIGEVKHSSSLNPLLSVLAATNDDILRNTTLSAIQNFNAPKVASQILEQFNSLPNNSATVAVATLASRPNWSRALLEAVDNGIISTDSIPLDAVRRMTMHDDQTISTLISKHWHSLAGKSSQQMKQQMQRVEEILTAGGGSPYAGKQLFLETCSKCHLLFGKGGRIGPDLTSYKRDDTSRMLLNIINPSAEVREGFETYVILTDDGRAVSGFLFDQDKRVVVLRGADGQNITIPRDEIEEMIRQPLSLMPEDLLTNFTDQQIRDLFSYLRTSQPISK